MPELDRRSFVRAGLAAGVGATLSPLLSRPSFAAPAVVRSGRPVLTHGLQSGDVSARGATVWSRADRPARMLVEVARTERFRNPWVVRGPVLLPDTDLTGRVRLTGLPPGAQVHYRVTLADPDDLSLRGAPLTGTFRTAPAGRRDVRFVWSGDLAGQGWGIDIDRGGFRIFTAMRALDPDFFLCSGDTVYADGPLPESVPLPDGSLWRNIVIPEKTKVAETLAEYRGQYKYNLLDANLRDFNLAVPHVNQWDDHEVTNNWYPGEILEDPRYTEKRVDTLAARAGRAFREYVPMRLRRDGEGRIYRRIAYGPHLDVFVLDMRTYKDRNTGGREKVRDGGVLGWEQLAWLREQLAESRATWKVLAADLPLGLLVPDGDQIEGIAQGDAGRPRGRELEIADLLRFVKRRGITGLVWLTADVHYTAAHHYAPARAVMKEFTPFWEFVSGPLNAGAFGPNDLDPTFGPRAVFVKAPPAPNTSPAAGYQFFGEVAIDGPTGALTVRLRDSDGVVHYTKRLEPARP